MCAFGSFIDELVADPAQAMAGNFVSELAVRGNGMRMPPESRGGGKDRERQVAPLERAPARATPSS